MNKIKKHKIEDTIARNEKTKQIYPDNYYSYDIHRHLQTNFYDVKVDEDENIYACCFRIVKSRANKIISNPFLQYLLYKYPNNKKSIKNLCVFPFMKSNGKDLITVSKLIINKIFDKIYNPVGYIKNDDGIFLFYHIDFDNVLVKTINKSVNYIWGLIDEICNLKKIVTFPIHYSVTNLFLYNPKLIYLKDKNKKCIEVPTTAYIGDTEELLNYIATLGIKSSAVRTFGPYYYLTDFKTAIREGGWSSNYEKRTIFNKGITDKNGKYNQGGIVRFALFLGNYRVILDRPTDTIYSYVRLLDRYSLNNADKKKERLIKKNKGKWTKNYDSLQISNYKNAKGSGYFWLNTGYITKHFNNFMSLSIHLIDKETLKINYDPDYELYDII